jgi:hypothetical protein
VLPLQYITAVLSRAAQGSVQLTDRLTILIVPFATLTVWALGAKMTSNVTETLAIGVAITVSVVVMLRLAAATYSLWKADHAEKARLQTALAAELDRPDRLEREAAITYTVHLRNELSDALAKAVAISELAYRHPDSKILRRDISGDSIDVHIRIRELINALSYDVPLRICAYNLSVLTSRIMFAAAQRKEASEDWERLQQLKKIVFRVLHKKEPNYELEMISMLEAQNLMESADDNAPGSFVSDDESNIEYLRRHLRDPDIAHEVRNKLRDGGLDPLTS